jgi:hypothetical protein
MNVWRWDKKEPILRFPVKDQLSVFKVSKNSADTSFCFGGSKKGALSIWQSIDG